MYLMGTRTKGEPVFVRLCSTLLKPGFPCSQFVEIVERIGVLTVADDTVDQVRVGFREINAGVVGCFLNLILFGNRTGRRFG